jgi:hypothetical protein
MEENRKAVLEWLNCGADYDRGALLYSRIGKNRNMATLFPGKKLRYEQKLRYELCKSAGLDWKNMSSVPPSVVTGSGTISMIEPFVFLDNHHVSNDTDAYPSLVRRVIHEYGEAYRLRGQLHYRMCDVPENNQPENVSLRKDFLLQIKALSARMEVLHQAKEDYLQRKVLPDPAVLWPLDKPVTDPVDPPLPEDPGELRRMKKNLQTSNGKDQHLLDYKGFNKQEVKSPMPKGPKRMTIEKRIRKRIALIERITLKLAEDDR